MYFKIDKKINIDFINEDNIFIRFIRSNIFW